MNISLILLDAFELVTMVLKNNQFIDDDSEEMSVLKKLTSNTTDHHMNQYRRF